MTILKTAQVKNAKPGKHHDGAGLYLVVTERSKKWVQRGTINGKRREYGLGAAGDIGLAEVREKAASYRRMLKDGIDPSVERKRVLAEQIAQEQAVVMPSFREVAFEVHKEHSPTWKNQKDVRLWLASLEKYVFPAIGDMPVDEVTGPMVRDVLAEIWLTKPDTARKIRPRIGVILDVAHGKGYRDHEAPRQAFVAGLPRQPKGKHLAAMPWAEVPDFIAHMDERLGASASVLRAIEFVILTAARSGEVRLATWAEFDLDKKVWNRPAAHMKAGIEHSIPLSSRAIALLGEPGEGLIFPSRKSGSALSDMTLSMPLRRAGVGYTMHGFRSSFRDWCGEATSTPREVAEACLAHAVGSSVERAYARSDLLEKRRAVMEQWGAFCCGADNVTLLAVVG
jgi:integrase